MAVAERVHARRSSFVPDVFFMAGRALRTVKREPETLLPALIMPAFFYTINIGALQDLVEQGGDIDFKVFQLPVAIVFAVAGLSRAVSLVLDIQSGYFDRLSLTPIRRLALLLGLMAADFMLVALVSIPVLIMGFAVGVRFETGVLGMLLFLVIAATWSLVYAGIPYAIALKTGTPAAVNTSFLLFFPLVFMTLVFIPLEAMTGWMQVIATYNPVTYLLGALRSLVVGGWDWSEVLKGLACMAGVGVVSVSLALATLRGRVSRN